MGLRILFVQNAQGIGGSENYLLRMLPAMRDRGHEVALAAVHNIRKPGSKAEVDRWLGALRQEGLTVHYRETAHYLDPSIVWWLRGVFRRGAAKGASYEIMHTHLIYADYWGAMLRVVLDRKVPAVSTVHGYEECIIERHALTPQRVPHNLYWWVLNATRRMLNQTYACSEGLKSFCAQAGIRGAVEWPVIEHGFDFPQLDPTTAEGHRVAEQQILVVGRLIHRKGMHLALDAFARLREKLPQAALVVVGGGPEQPALQSQAEALGLSEAVHFKGFDAQPFAWMQASDLLLVPSLAEGLPLVLFEGMHAECPVLAFDTIGCRDMIQHAHTGWLVDAYQTDALAERMRWLLEHPEQAKRTAKRAKAQLCQRNTLSTMTEKTLALYRRILQLEENRS
jgi:glycosyltransferase involved in cell wall biosynthesis